MYVSGLSGMTMPWQTHARMIQIYGQNSAPVRRYEYNMAGSGLFGWSLHNRDVNNYWNTYFSNYPGASWEKVRYPTMMYGSGVGTAPVAKAQSMAPFVSSNIASLYNYGYGFRKHGHDPMYG